MIFWPSTANLQRKAARWRRTDNRKNRTKCTRATTPTRKRTRSPMWRKSCAWCWATLRRFPTLSRFCWSPLGLSVVWPGGIAAESLQHENQARNDSAAGDGQGAEAARMELSCSRRWGFALRAAARRAPLSEAHPVATRRLEAAHYVPALSGQQQTRAALHGNVSRYVRIID